MYEKFAKLLEERGITIYRVAQDTGIPETTLYDWKSGRSQIKIDKLLIIANYFGVPITDFLEEQADG